MAYKEVTDLSADVTFAIGGKNKKTGKENPTQVEGYYLGKRAVASPKSKSGTANIYFLKTQKGNVGVWGKTDLDRKLSTAVPGTMLRITLARMVPTPNGDMYSYKVEFDADNTIEVSVQNEDVADSGNDGDEYGYNSSTDVGQDEDDSQSEALAAAERKAQVAALLKGGGKAKRG